MKGKLLSILPAIFSLLLVALPVSAGAPTTIQAKAQGSGSQGPADPQAIASNAFTYQGQLMQSGSPASGQYDLRFTIFDALTGGNQAGGTLTLTNQTVTNGLFTVTLDFGSNVFTGSAAFLQIEVRATGGGSFIPLLPRQPLTPSPYALSLRPGAVISGTVAGNLLSLTNTGAGSGLVVTTNGPVGMGGTSTATNGIGTEGVAVVGPSGIGVWGIGSGTGTLGTSTGGTGVQGNGIVGVNGAGSGATGKGVQGQAYGTTSSVGVSGVSDAGYGVTGSSNTGTGAHFFSNSGLGATATGGVYGFDGAATTANGIGVRGTSGTGTTAVGVLGFSTIGTGISGGSNSGYGGRFTSLSGTGVYATGGNGIYSVGTASNGVGVWGVADNGTGAYGVYGTSSSGAGVVGSTTSGIALQGTGNGASTVALQIDNGAIEVAGAGTNTATPVFQTVSTSGNLCGTRAFYLDNPYTNNNPNAILIITKGVSAPYLMTMSVEYNSAGCPSGKWVIEETGVGSAFPTGVPFNVLVFRP